MFLRPA
jgi:hypothetical protein